jgi:hypothetical protein
MLLQQVARCRQSPPTVDLGRPVGCSDEREPVWAFGSRVFRHPSGHKVGTEWAQGAVATDTRQRPH